MARIRSSNTTPERILRQELHRLGFRYRLNVKSLPGKPDLVFARYKTVIFVHGCFWHQHQGCRISSNPKSNVGFWQLKFARNAQRHEQAAKMLEASGWRVLVVWECELGGKNRRSERIRQVAKFIRDIH